MSVNQNIKRFDLEERTLNFAKNVRLFIKDLPRSLTNLEDGKQLIRSSGSIGANYIEANESLSKKDFKMRIMICRKEAKETCYWLKLISTENENERTKLLNEATEILKIFGAIYEKTK
ncbi:MAG TPA: four helix bundle protein [Patescibacteria group bacterium]